MEIEATGDAVDVEDFACEKKVWARFTGQSRRIDARQRNAAASDEFVLEWGATVNLKCVVAKGVREAVEFLSIQSCPAILRPLAEAFSRQIFPQPTRQIERFQRENLFLSVFFGHRNERR